MKRSAIKEVVFPGQLGSVTWWNHLTFRVFRAVIWMVCLFRLFFIPLDNYLGEISLLQNFLSIIIGDILLAFGFLLTITVNRRLGEHWRSGIDPSGPVQLISDGFYKYTRNPMFLGVAISQFGFFLALPSVFTFVCLVIGLYTLHSQVLSEEKHLAEVYPNEYKNYTSQVRRWI